MYKICYITTTPAPMRGFILPTAKYFHEKGDFDISLICSPIENFEEMVPSYIHFIPVEMKRGASLDGGKVISQLTKIFKKEKFDLIQYSTPNASVYASIAGKLAKVPVRLYCQWGLVFEGFSGYKRKIFKILEKNTCKNSTWVEPDSFGNLDYCRKLGFYDENKSSVVLYGSSKGVDLGFFDYSFKEDYRAEVRQKYNIPQEAFVFGFVGSITGDKGTNELISAFKSISEEHKDVFLIIVGEPEKEQSLSKELIEWAKNNKNVIFTGLSHTVPKELSAMDCFVTPSYREGFPTAVLEAGSMGLSVIASDIPGHCAITNEFNGLIVEKKSVEPLIKAMERVYKDRELCEMLGNNALAFIREHYDQKKVFQAIYEDRIRLLEGNK